MSGPKSVRVTYPWESESGSNRDPWALLGSIYGPHKEIRTTDL